MGCVCLFTSRNNIKLAAGGPNSGQPQFLEG